MAVANARAAGELRELADTQAALQRLAMLVAAGELPETVFAEASRNGTTAVVMPGTRPITAKQAPIMMKPASWSLRWPNRSIRAIART